MADRYWVGANGTSGAAIAYATTASWSATKDGPNGVSIPSAAVPDIVRFDNSTAGSKFVNVNQSIGNIPNIYFVGSGLNWSLCGSTSAIAGTAWTLTAPVTIDVGPGVNIDAQFNNNITASGAAKIIKTGLGSLSNYTISTTTWGACPIDLQAGTILFYFTTDKLGTGKITQSGGTYLAVASSLAATLNNPIDVIGDVVWNYEPNLPASTARGLMTLKATVDFGSVTRTVQVGATGNTNSATISGAIIGSAGFTKAGTGTLTIAHATNPALNNISGTVSVSGGGGLALGAFNSGRADQLSAITSFALSNGVVNRGVEYAGVTAYSEDASFTGTSGTVQTSNTGGLTFTGDLSAFSGTFGVYNTTTDTATVWQNTTSFPAVATQFRFLSDTNSRTLTMQYAGSGNVSNTAGTVFLSPNSGSAITLTAIMENASTAGATMAFGGPVTSQQTSAIGTVNFQPTVGAAAGAMTFSGVISQGSTGTLRVTKAGAGKVILSGANTYTGATSTVASGGTLVAQKGGATNGALGAASASTAVTIVSGTTLEIDGSAETIALTKTNSILNIGGTGVSSAGVVYSYGDGLVDSSNSYAAASTLLTATATIQVGTKNTLTMTGAIGSGVNVYGITQIGTGKLVLPSSGYLGVTTINGGIIETATLANGGAASGVGQSSNAATNLLIGTTANAGTLRYTGAAASTNRNWTAGTAGATIDASGSGVLTMTSTTVPSFSATNTATTITVQGLAGDGTTTFNTYSQPISNNGTGAVGFTKAGTGAWKLTNATIDATGALTISGGFLDLNNTARSLSANIVASGGTLQNGSATVTPASSVSMSGGKITANLAGASKTLTVTGASLATVSELAPEATNNAVLTGGTASINSGTLRLTAETTTIGAGGGKVLGTMAVTVANGAAIRTTTGALYQRGQARYQNLTFSSGSSLYIGG